MAQKHTEKEQARLYLITPPTFDLATFPDQISRVLDCAPVDPATSVPPVACVRLALASKDESIIAKSGDILREICHARDIPLVIENHLIMAERLGLDGVHLTDGARTVRYARKELGKDAIIGAFCGASRHEGMSAGEAGADYVSFGPCGENTLGDGSVVAMDLFHWWSDVIEVPVVAEGALNQEITAKLSGSTDFFAFGEEIWNSDDPVENFKRLVGFV